MTPRRWAIAILMLLAILLLAGHAITLLTGGDGPPAAAWSEDRMQEVNSQPLPDPMVEPRIVIEKRQRRVMLYSGGRLVRVYRAAMGKHADEGDKMREGDRRTPQGEYYICVKNPNSKYYLSLGISYPNAADAARGLAAGVIDRDTHDLIVDAIERKVQPPWKTEMGGEIFIHGQGASRDWTLGCIALDDPDMKELYEAVPVGAPVSIRP